MFGTQTKFGDPSSHNFVARVWKFFKIHEQSMGFKISLLARRHLLVEMAVLFSSEIALFACKMLREITGLQHVLN